MAKITAARSDFNGYVAGAKFENGQAETTDDAAIAYFVRAGYDVSGADGFEIEHSEDRSGAIIGVPYANPDSGPYADAADSRNDSIPVGGVKDDGTIVAGPNKGKKLSRAATPPVGSPDQPVQATGDPETTEAVVSAPNPPEATTPVDAPVEVAPNATGQSTEPGTDSAGTPATDSSSSSKKGA